MPDEGRETTPPGPEEFLKGNVAKRPGVATSLKEAGETSKKKTGEKVVRLGPTKPTKQPIKERGWWK